MFAVIGAALAVFSEHFVSQYTPEPIKDWSMTTLKEKLIKIGAKIVSHGRYIAFQMAEVVVPRMLLARGWSAKWTRLAWS